MKDHDDDRHLVEADDLASGGEARSEAPRPREGISGWRKAALWLFGATLLAFVGYRGALGDRVAGTASIDPSPMAHPPASAAATTGTLSERAPGEIEPRQGSPESTATAKSPATDASPVTHEGASAAENAPPTKPGGPEATPRGPSSEAARPDASSQAITTDGKIILNLATDTDLQKLPGIGKARAKAILTLRERLGKFRRIEELLRVKGIGRKRLQAIRNKIVLDPS